MRHFPVHIRWCIARDMPEVLAIEQASFDSPWAEEDFTRCLRLRNCIGMVAEHGEKVIGFFVYELATKHLDILNFAVHPEYRGGNVGTQMAEKLASKLSPVSRKRIKVHVRETNLAAQLFFRAVGYRAIKVVRGFYEDSSEDAYLFQKQVRVLEGVR